MEKELANLWSGRKITKKAQRRSWARNSKGTLLNMPLIKIVYVSAATKPFTQAALRDLLSKARTFNSSVGVSGLLLYHERSFFQILEGQEKDVTPLFERIGRDRRHNRVLLLSKQEAEGRNFGDWSMGV